MAAADWYERAAAQGHPRAAVAIATILLSGQGRPQDKEAAGAYFEKAAEADDPQGLYRAGLMRLTGDGLPQNLVRAESYLRRAAKKNDLHAILALAEFYSRGAHVEPDLREAYVWYRRAAELGDARAQFIVGRLSATGAGVVANLRESAHWFLQSAEKGDPLAAHNIACLYARGDGVEKGRRGRREVVQDRRREGRCRQPSRAGAQPAEAERPAPAMPSSLAPGSRKPSGAGDNEAKVTLASLHLIGEVVQRDLDKSERLLREAAEEGFAPAARRLGHLYSGHFDFPPNLEEAARWYRVGSEANDAEFAISTCRNVPGGHGRSKVIGRGRRLAEARRRERKRGGDV